MGALRPVQSMSDAMRQLNTVSYIAERDVDLLLLEEINVNPRFAAWLHARVTSDTLPAPDCKGAWHSVTHPTLGESDLVVVYENGLAILIENKVDAPAQPEQAIRYRRRGEAGVADGWWSQFVTCIIAPDRYLQTDPETQRYDRKITYQQLEDWFKKAGTPRAAYKAYLINQAIDQQRRGYSPQADEDVTRFWLAYWTLASTSFPALRMRHPGIKPAGSDWPVFRPEGCDSQFRIVHKMSQGCVDLEIAGAGERLDEIREWIGTGDLEVVRADKSAAVRVPAGVVDRFGNFEAQREIIEAALNAASRLMRLARTIEVPFQPFGSCQP